MSNEKPNIIYIFSDQHRGDALGCVGHPAIKTPHLDRMASQGVTFTRCHTNAPLCMPSRATMMTGQHVREHGIWDNNVALAPETVPSHVRNIRDAGYHTALIGKTHLYLHSADGPPPHSRDCIPILNAWGFDDVHELHGPRASGKRDSLYTDYLKKEGLLDTHRDAIADFMAQLDGGTLKLWADPPCPLPTEAHLDSYTGRTTAEWIQNYSNDKPFYLQVLFPGPHDPFDSPREYRDMYSPEDLPEGILEPPADPVPPYVAGNLRRTALKDMTVAEKKQMLTNYYAKITLIDEYIGRIMDALEQTGRLDNTWVIYSSDHGEMLGDHRLGFKSVFYDAAVRVPCIIRPPGGTDAWQSAALTDTLDVVASLVDIAGAAPMEGGHGRSLTEQISAGPDAAGAQQGKDVLFSEVSGYTMILDGQYKLVIAADTQMPQEHYDVKSDPDELHNRVADPTLESVRQNLIETYANRVPLNESKFESFRSR